jgi:uncharacterized protein (DUF2344 family)
MKIVSISQVREQAMELGLFNKGEKRFLNLKLNEVEEDKIEEKEPENFDKNLEERISESKSEKELQLDKLTEDEYVVEVPSLAKKQDLVELKNFLQEEES